MKRGKVSKHSMNSNEYKHRQARKQAGITGCLSCKDTGHVTIVRGNRLTTWMGSNKCTSCRCWECDKEALENNFCEDHQDKAPGPELAESLRKLINDCGKL